jgi:hypothetical protein
VEANFYPKTEFEELFARYVSDKEFSTLIFGTSRAYEGIHPVYIEQELGEKAYKETFQGKGPKYNYYFYKVYKKYAGVPKVVIYGVDYFVYTVISDPKWMSRFDIDQTEEEKIDYFSSPLLLLEYKEKIDNFHNNVLIHFQELQASRKKKEDCLQDFFDMDNYTGIEIPDKKLIGKRPRRYERQFFPRPPGKEGRYFEKLIEELAADNVTVILVGLPDYFGSYKTNFEREEFLLNLKRIAREYKSVYIYNYNRPRNFDLRNPDYFNDGGYGQTNSHLSKTGAKEFNRILCQDLKKHYR